MFAVCVRPRGTMTTATLRKSGCRRRTRRGCSHAADFVVDQAASLLSGKAHHAHATQHGRGVRVGTPAKSDAGGAGRPCAVQPAPQPHAWSTHDAVVMTLSCMAYLACSVVWWRFGFTRLQYWFYLVTVCSTVADGIRVPFAPVRTLDRIVGSTGLVSAMVVNSTTVANTALVTFTMVSAVWWLRRSRAAAAVAHLTPGGHAAYVWAHAAWHVYGAAALCAMTCYIQTR